MKYELDSLQSRLLRGDPGAVGIVSRWVADVVTEGRNWRLRSEWQDLHQEALSGILASLRAGRFDPSRDFQSYVLALTRYTLWRAARKRRRMQVDPLDPADPGPIAPGPSPEVKAVMALTLRSAIVRLARPCRELIEAYYFEQRGYDEIAATLGVPVGTVKSRLYRCLEGVRETLAEASARSASVVREGTATRFEAKTKRALRIQEDEPAP